MRNSKQPLALRLALVSFVAVSAAPGMVLAQTSQTKTVPVPQKVDKAVKQRALLNDEIMRLSQPLNCKTDSDCESIALGAKPCGGPWKYILYSKKNSKIAALKKKVAEYNHLDQKLNESQQTMSDCSMRLEPQPKCEKSFCIDSANVNAPNAAAGLETITPAPAPHH